MQEDRPSGTTIIRRLWCSSGRHTVPVESGVERADAWSEWLTDDGPVAGTVHRLELDRERWRQLREMVAANPAIPSAEDTLGWFWYHYAADAAVRLRRLADEDHRSASLGRLLVELAEASSTLTRDWFVDKWREAVLHTGLWEALHRDMANRWFDEFEAASGDGLSVDLVESDLHRLRHDLAAVKHFVDKRLAHHNPLFDPELSYLQISGAIDTVGSLFRRYTRLIRRVDPLPLTDNTNWGDAFSVAWRS